jgi:DNA repair exonuclease SbcCD ATPase subunit
VSKEHEIHFYEENTDCPTCKQQIDEIFRETKIKERREKVKEQQTGLNELIEELQNTENRINEITIVFKKINEGQSEISKNSYSISALQKYIEKIREELKELIQIGTIQEQVIQLDLYNNNLNQIVENLKKQYDIKELHNVAGTILKDSGIKSRIIKTYLPIINTCIQRNLSALDFYVSFELDENFNETIRSRYRDDFTYSSFSEGEKMRIDLALLFSWRQVAKIKNSMNTNLLILDEVFDSSLDSNGTEEFLKLINSLDKNINTFVISHKGEVLYDKFANVVKFEKKNYFSHIIDYERPSIS